MTKQEYLAELRAALSDLSAEEASRACAFYEEMIDDRMEAGEDERDAVAAMEPPRRGRVAHRGRDAGRAARPGAGRHASISEVADALADESRDLGEKSLYTTVSVIAAGLGI